MAQFDLPPPPVELPQQRWFQLLYARILGAHLGGFSFIGLDFTLSNLTSIITRNHNDLTAIQGGVATDYQHLTTAQVAQVGTIAALTTTVGTHTTQLAGLAGGLNVTIVTAKLTAGGANGSMTFTNGVLTAQTPAT